MIAGKPQVLKGVGKVDGDGWKDTTQVGEVVFVWNDELPPPYKAGQFPRIGCEHYTASTDQYDFTPATIDEIRAALFTEAAAYRWSFDGGNTWAYGPSKPESFAFGDPDVAEPLYTRSYPGKDGGQEVVGYTRPEYIDALRAGEVTAIAGKPFHGSVPLYTLTQPASTALVERLTKALEKIAGETTIGEPFKSEDRIMSRDAMIEHARSALSASHSTSREGESQ